VRGPRDIGPTRISRAATGRRPFVPPGPGRRSTCGSRWADFNLLKLPAGTEHENDFAMLSDIFPTGYHGAELAGVTPGDTVAIFGAGPVGLMAAHSAALRGAAQVFVVDRPPTPTPASTGARTAGPRSCCMLHPAA
jgi:glutathione-independent formaldehyde dehydrogenase